MKARGWYLIGGLTAVVGLIIALTAAFGGNSSPREYVEGRYTRAADRDLGSDAMAFRSDQPPTEVAADLAGAWEPADRYVDGSGVYLRYADDSVVIVPLALGSLILVERMRTAHPRYYGIVGGGWGWGTGWGESVRGGGPGGGGK